MNWAFLSPGGGGSSASVLWGLFDKAQRTQFYKLGLRTFQEPKKKYETRKKIPPWFKIQKEHCRFSPVVQWLGLCLSM